MIDFTNQDLAAIRRVGSGFYAVLRGFLCSSDNAQNLIDLYHLTYIMSDNSFRIIATYTDLNEACEFMDMLIPTEHGTVESDS